MSTNMDKNIRIDERLWHKAKIEAARQKITVKDLVTLALERFLGGKS